MKKSLFLFFCCFFLLFTTALAAPTTLPAASAPDTLQKSFESYIQTELAPIYSTYEGPHYSILFLKGDPQLGTKDTWVKTKTLLHKTYKTTISTLPNSSSPQGTFEINSTTYIYPRSSSAAMAVKQATPTSTKGDTYRYTFLYENGQWKLTIAKSFDSVQRRWFPSDMNFTKTLHCPDEKH